MYVRREDEEDGWIWVGTLAAKVLADGLAQSYRAGGFLAEVRPV